MSSSTYDITSHSLLSAEAADLQANHPNEFDAHVYGAELVHQLHGTSHTGADADLAKLILVYQVNYQVDVAGQDVELYDEIVRGDRSYSIRDHIGVSDTAKMLREQLASRSQAPKLQRYGFHSTSKKSTSEW